MARTFPSCLSVHQVSISFKPSSDSSALSLGCTPNAAYMKSWFLASSSVVLQLERLAATFVTASMPFSLKLAKSCSCPRQRLHRHNGHVYQISCCLCLLQIKYIFVQAVKGLFYPGQRQSQVHTDMTWAVESYSVLPDHAYFNACCLKLCNSLSMFLHHSVQSRKSM